MSTFKWTQMRPDVLKEKTNLETMVFHFSIQKQADSMQYTRSTAAPLKKEH